jgi:hypothetical protein
MTCIPWTDEEWLANSQPATPRSEYTLKDTRYNQAGVAARTYLEDDGWWYAILPGVGNRDMFPPLGVCGGTDPRAAALTYLANAGYTLTDVPTPDESPALS